jgi:hypothetical protein
MKANHSIYLYERKIKVELCAVLPDLAFKSAESPEVITL